MHGITEIKAMNKRVGTAEHKADVKRQQYDVLKRVMLRIANGTEENPGAAARVAIALDERLGKKTAGAA
jgi:hypothetical protein